MELKLYTVFDSKSEMYLPPFTSRNNGEAIRSFSDTINNDGHSMNMHPGDYTLFELGKFNDSDAMFEILLSPVSLGVGVEFVNKE